ncbi:MAG: hypothetical protein JSW64_09315 [Candidatus Zixiibacteriota bacterium]|nr:MAG: hypothetical protein JSW64_09315 [candidate division Zixibacteria bacterium]
MKNNLIVLVLTLILLGGALFSYQRFVVPQPDEIKRLNLEIEDKNKRLLAAQILAEKREGITALIKNNLVNSPSDSLTEKSSIPFLRYLTATMDRLRIRLVALTPMDVIGTDDIYTYEKKEYIEVPYELKIIASYEEFGKFLDILEKAPHLTKVTSFSLSNEIERSSFIGEIRGKPNQHPINLQISTLAILKASYRGELGEFN